MKPIKTDTLSRRQLLPLLGGAAALAAVAPHSTAADPSGRFGKLPAAKARFVYVGAYTFPGTAPGGTHQSQAKGIYVFRMNPGDGGLRLLQIAEIPNPSYLALDPTLRHLYSVNEMTDGGVSAYVINQANGMLTPLNTLVPTNGQDTTHLSVQPSGQYLFAASYTSGTFQVFRILADGTMAQ
jgi:6-phosphogluconolactonase